MWSRQIIRASLAVTVLAATVEAQVPTARDRARPSYEAGLAHMQSEAFDAAVDSFQGAIRIDPQHEMAHYMLGRVQLMLRQYVAASHSLARSRELFAAQANERFTDKQEGDRRRRDSITELEKIISQLQTQKPTPQITEMIRQYTERKRLLQDYDRHSNMPVEQAVPGFVSLSLGSAYFRSGKLEDAEKAYLAAIATDSKMGEAHNNLAVVYMETGRLELAEKSIKNAEKAGMRVNPALKDEIAKRKNAGIR